MSRAEARLDEWLERRPELVRKVVLPAGLKWEVRDKLDQTSRSASSFQGWTASAAG